MAVSEFLRIIANLKAALLGTIYSLMNFPGILYLCLNPSSSNPSSFFSPSSTKTSLFLWMYVVNVGTFIPKYSDKNFIEVCFLSPSIFNFFTLSKASIRSMYCSLSLSLIKYRLVFFMLCILLFKFFKFNAPLKHYILFLFLKYIHFTVALT
ncbi:hypothetical protein LL3_02334 [Bacillus amyloliquefaciens LL3]|nr:hypothetical protein LL3_02334 [Bacillus amyloliquefaciens LL3]